MDLYKKAISPTALSETQSDELRQRANSRVVALMRTGMTAEKAKEQVTEETGYIFGPPPQLKTVGQHHKPRRLASVEALGDTLGNVKAKASTPEPKPEPSRDSGTSRTILVDVPQITHSDPEAVPVENIPEPVAPEPASDPTPEPVVEHPTTKAIREKVAAKFVPRPDKPDTHSVKWDYRYGNWTVRIGRKWVGAFDNYEAAVQARDQAEKNPEFKPQGESPVKRRAAEFVQSLEAQKQIAQILANFSNDEAWHIVRAVQGNLLVVE